MLFRRAAGLLTALALATAPTAASAQFSQEQLDGARQMAEEAERRDRAAFPLLLLAGAVILALVAYLITEGQNDEDKPVSP